MKVTHFYKLWYTILSVKLLFEMRIHKIKCGISLITAFLICGHPRCSNYKRRFESLCQVTLAPVHQRITFIRRFPSVKEKLRTSQISFFLNAFIFVTSSDCISIRNRKIALFCIYEKENRLDVTSKCLLWAARLSFSRCIWFLTQDLYCSKSFYSVNITNTK